MSTESILADITARFQVKEVVQATAQQAARAATLAATAAKESLELKEAARSAIKDAKEAKEAAAAAAKEYTRFLNVHHERISKELAEVYVPNTKEWWTAFDANPIIQEWRADFHYRMNASKGW